MTEQTTSPPPTPLTGEIPYFLPTTTPASTATFEESEEIHEWMSAMLEVRKELRAAETTKAGQVQNRTFRYADMFSCKEAAEPVLTKHGFVSNQWCDAARRGTWTELYHVPSKQYRRMMVSWETGDERGGTAMQRWGSVNTYARRYGYETLVGLARVEDSDSRVAPPARSDDGSRAVPDEPVPDEIVRDRTKVAIGELLTGPAFRVPKPMVPRVVALAAEELKLEQGDDGNWTLKQVEKMEKHLRDMAHAGVKIGEKWPQLHEEYVAKKQQQQEEEPKG